MKRAISLVFLLVCLFFIYQFGVNYLKNTHEVAYTIQNNNYVYEVKEVFNKDHYDIEIEKDNYTFYLQQDNSFNKQKHILKTIEWKQENDVLCIYPVYQENISSHILCSDKKQMYSKDSINNKSLTVIFTNELKEKKYNIPESKEETVRTYGQVNYYTSAIDETIILWLYQGFLKMNNEEAEYYQVMPFDRYENTLSALVGKYYVTPAYNNNVLFEIDSFEVYDVTSEAQYTLSLDQPLSDFSYKNGVVDNKLYIFDKNTMTQIEIDPKKKIAQVIGNTNLNGQDYQGSWETRNIYDFGKTLIQFSSFDQSQLQQKYSYISAVEDENSYYFYDGGGLYQVYKQNLDKKILLLKQQNMKEIQVIDGNIYYIVNDTVYKYNKREGNQRILKYSELQYNYENIYAIYR